jgi:hypothetical protein
MGDLDNCLQRALIDELTEIVRNCSPADWCGALPRPAGSSRMVWSGTTLLLHAFWPTRERAMRAKKGSNNKRSNFLSAATLFAVASHAAMGMALGLVFALILIRTPFFGVLALINVGHNPHATMTMFVGTVIVMFGFGAALTGIILMMEDAGG